MDRREHVSDQGDFPLFISFYHIPSALRHTFHNPALLYFNISEIGMCLEIDAIAYVFLPVCTKNNSVSDNQGATDFMTHCTVLSTH